MRIWLLLLALMAVSFARADELRPAYLQLTEQSPGTYTVLWKVPARGEQRLALQVRFEPAPADTSEPVEGFLNGAHLQQWSLTREQGLAGTRVSIEGLPRTSTEALLRVEYLDGSSVTHRLTPAAPEVTLAAQPTLLDTAQTYLVLGIEHILLGIDHLLFVLALLLLINSTRKLILTITAFTIAHSITLSLASLGIIRIPVPPVEAVIALSIVFVAAEILRAQRGQPGITQRNPWLVAFSFGLLHGLGFAAALGEIGLPQNAVALALVFFNVGVEVGNLLFVFAFLALTALARKLAFQPGRILQKVPPYFIGSLASFWLFERVAAF
ncbi:HupE/UreJ family protein [Marinobacter salinisoli]|uniref:HupE/UreJ family protein n=1 Tax=Marinobacter salinisoli TaxID=2769486 RepID=A0ABX7MPK7_9GAMM|nr:HupE/UreJ family protein [Marinobacter salinisoli]QSP93299.1 HupE/UreJ family protein [Marinobacter salinisoli]